MDGNNQGRKGVKGSGTPRKQLLSAQVADMLVYALARACVWVTNMETLFGRGFLDDPLTRTVLKIASLPRLTLRLHSDQDWA